MSSEGKITIVKEMRLNLEIVIKVVSYCYFSLFEIGMILEFNRHQQLR